MEEYTRTFQINSDTFPLDIAAYLSTRYKVVINFSGTEHALRVEARGAKTVFDNIENFLRENGYLNGQ